MTPAVRRYNYYIQPKSHLEITKILARYSSYRVPDSILPRNILAAEFGVKSDDQLQGYATLAQLSPAKTLTSI